MVMMIGTLAVLDAYYPGGMFTLFARGAAPNAADETYARTMAFTTLMIFQLCNVFSCRSHWRSAFSGFSRTPGSSAPWPFRCLHVLVIYVPVLQAAFHTTPLAMMDWVIAAGVGATLLVVMELVKLALRRSRGSAHQHSSPEALAEGWKR